jgi:two-component system, OmpR family, sensor histidine kinase KdpD
MMITPDEILENINREESKKSQGKLKIFFGMCAGVGKTYSMLLYAKELVNNGHNVIVGYIETHGRAETAKLLDGLTIIPRKKIDYKGIILEEFDLEKAIELKPDFILVDELAHSNVPGLKHSKRYQDVLELIENGINVLTTLNVQHIESRSKTVEQITGATIQETVPDSIIEIAENIELIDLPIEELLERMSEGKVYVPEKAKIAFQNFFKPGNLISLREMSLRLTAEKVEGDLINYMSKKNIQGPWKTSDKLLVAVSASPFSAELIKSTRRMAYALKSHWYAVYVKTDTAGNENANVQLEKNLRLAKELGAEVITTADTDFVDGLLEVARNNNVSQIIIGKPAKYNIFNYLKRDNYIDRLINESGDIDIYIVRPSEIKNKPVKKRKVFVFRSTLKDYIFSICTVLLLSAICFPLKDDLGYQTIGLILLFNLLLMPFYVGRGPIIVSAILNTMIWNYFFIPPLFTFEIHTLHDLLTMLLSLVVAIITGFLSTKIRQQKSLVQMRERNNLVLLNFTKELYKCESKLDAVNILIKHININYSKNINNNIFATFLNDKIEPIVRINELLMKQKFSPRMNDLSQEFSTKELSIAKWSLENNKIAGKFTDNLPESTYQYFPITTNRSKIGVLCLFLNQKLSIEEENLLINMISQMSVVFEKEESHERIVKSLKVES